MNSHRGHPIAFLSSGLRTQYLEDMIRATAMPAGAHLRFRYRKKDLPGPISDAASRNKLVGREAVLTFAADAKRKIGEPTPIPCRIGYVVKTRDAGEYVVIYFELREYAVADDLPAFRSALSKSGCDFPTWTAPPDEKLKGMFAHEVPGLRDFYEKSLSNDAWQKVVTQLKATLDFAAEPFFYRVEGLFELPDEDLLQPTSGAYSLRPSCSYEFRVLHFDPGDVSPPIQTMRQSLWLIVEIEGRGMERLTSAMLPIESPYDVKCVEFRSHSLTTQERSLVTFYRIPAPGVAPAIEDSVRDFDLRLEVRGHRLRPIAVGLFIGVLLTAQQLVAMKQGLELWQQVVAIFTASFAAAIVAAFGLRKPS